MKNLLFSAATLFFSFSALAQLFVSPNGATDSYVYVQDQVLYVEQDVEMDVNPTAATKASIYLRQGAQLIQGESGVMDNSGNGKLSVYQNAPNSDQWTYNYWCSPVGITPAGTPGNQNFGMYRIFQIDGVTEGTQAIPVQGLNGSSAPLRISQRWIYKKPRGFEAESDYVWVGPGNGVGPGMGFTMKGVDGAPIPVVGYEYDFRGRPNNGDIDVNVYNGEWTLSGNPYPSALDLNRVFWDGDNTEIQQFRYWDESKTVNSHLYLENEGGYGTYVPGTSNPNGLPTDGASFQAGSYTPPTFMIFDATGTATAGSGGVGLDLRRRFAPIGQGFVIVPDATTDGVVTLKNSHRRYIKEGTGNHSEFRSQGAVQDPSNNDGRSAAASLSQLTEFMLPQLRINTEFGTSHVRQTLLLFSDESTDLFDRGLDGVSPMDATSEAYFPVGEEQVKMPLVINTVPFEMAKRVPFAFELDRQFDIKIDVVSQINMEYEAYFWDSQNNTFQLLTSGTPAEVSLPAGVHENRFFIVFRGYRDSITSSPGSTLKSEVKASVDFFQNNPVKQLEVSNPEGYEIKTANIFDMSGKLVFSDSNLGNDNRLTFPTGNLSDGIYLVMLTTADDINIDYKITVYNR